MRNKTPYYNTHGNTRLVHFGFSTYKQFIKKRKMENEKQKTKETKEPEQETTKTTWKKVESEIFKFTDIGDEIEGKLISVSDSQTHDNKVYQLEVGEKNFTVFSTKVLETMMNNIKVGEDVKIVFKGTKPNPKKGQNDTKLFDVFTR